MIPDLSIKVERQNWQTELSQSFTQLNDLLSYLKIDATAINVEQNPSFPLRVPLPFARKMQKGNPLDPLLRQVLPTQKISELTSSFAKQPLQEAEFNPVPGMLHKFSSRVLLITGQSCAVHCRYCFRQHFPYEDNKQSRAQWQQAFEYIKQNESISEIILSGGDPLNCSDLQLAWFISSLSEISHVKIIRLHTRTPVVIPSRLTDKLAQILTQSRLNCVMVLHCNHPNEIDADLTQRLVHFKKQGITLLNQSVLLKGVNDDADVLIQLSHQLFEAGVLPYYLHLLDKVLGSELFEVKNDIPELIKTLHMALPGYLVPKVVREVPGLPYKKPYDLSFL